MISLRLIFCSLSGGNHPDSRLAVSENDKDYNVIHHTYRPPPLFPGIPVVIFNTIGIEKDKYRILKIHAVLVAILPCLFRIPLKIVHALLYGNPVPPSTGPNPGIRT
jgi:hypothetical protein